MTVYCPNCNKELGPEERVCSSCGTPRPPTLQKLPTKILNQTEPGAVQAVVAAPEPLPVEPGPVAPSTAPGPLPVPEPEEQTLPAPLATVPASSWNFTPAAPEAPAPAAVAPVEAAPATLPEKAEPALPTFWKCNQCISLNPSTSEYCENCGAPAPSTAPVQLGQLSTLPPLAPGLADSEMENATVKLPSDIVAALAASHSGPAPVALRLHSSSATDVGISRKGGSNEDSYFTLELQRSFEGHPEIFGLYIVADGMGGQAAGEVASRMAIETVAPIILSELAGPWMTGEKLQLAYVEKVLHDAVALAHTRIHEYNLSEERDAGTTLTSCCVVQNEVVFANVGDSRTYLFRLLPPAEQELADKTDPVFPLITPGMVAEAASERNTVKLNQSGRERATDKLNPRRVARIEPAQPPLLIERVTRDQSLVQQLVDIGELEHDEVYNDPRRNVILHALGAPDEQVPVDVYRRTLQGGDTILLCSDGLWEMIRDYDIAEQVAAPHDLTTCARNLINLANQNGGADNITVVLVRVEQ